MVNSQKRVTIYDIAAKTQLSPSTVSRVLGNIDYPVSQEIRERILAVAKELDYHPNLWARNLKKRNSRTIGVVLPSISNPFFPSIVQGIEDEAYENGYSLLICSGDQDPEREENYFSLLIENHVRGIISVLADPVTDGINQYLKQGGAVISIQAEQSVSDDRVNNFYFDIEQANYLATKHLLDLGHQKIAYLTAPLNSPIRQNKVNGYKRALKEAGIDFSEQYLYIANYKTQPLSPDNKVIDSLNGTELTRQLVKKTPEVTAILCMNDLMALGSLALLQEKEFNVPGDFSLMGFDDLFFSELIKPRLTTVRLEKYKVGRLAMAALINLFENNHQISSYNLSDHISIVKRESVGKPRLA